MTIGIITNDDTQVFQADIIAGVREVATDAGYSVEVDAVGSPPSQVEITLPLNDLNGIIVIANVLSDAQLAALVKINTPVTLVSHRVPGLPVPAVIQNNVDGINRLVDYLVTDCGCREFVFIAGDMDQHDGHARTQMFKRRLLFHDLEIAPEYILRGDFIPVVAHDSMLTFLEHESSFDAVVAADYLMGVAALDAMRNQGVAVPDEVQVVGFGNGPEAEDAGLTTVRADILELGRRATRQLLVQMDGTPLTGVTWLSTALIERDSSRRQSAS